MLSLIVIVRSIDLLFASRCVCDTTNEWQNKVLSILFISMSVAVANDGLKAASQRNRESTFDGETVNAEIDFDRVSFAKDDAQKRKRKTCSNTTMSDIEYGAAHPQAPCLFESIIEKTNDDIESLDLTSAEQLNVGATLSLTDSMCRFNDEKRLLYRQRLCVPFICVCVAQKHTTDTLGVWRSR